VADSVAEITSILGSCGANEVRIQYDGARNVAAIAFKAATQFGEIAFSLPANVGAAQRVLNKQVELRQIPKRYLNDSHQARRICWRILKDWLTAQLALIEIGMASVEQIFLPYAQAQDGRTVFEELRDRKFKGLALTNGESKP
jgi:hypothetical protein